MLNNIKLSKRLNVIASLVNHNRVCDVGCDHGKVIAYLFQNKIIDYAIITDISEKCVFKADSLLKQLNINNYNMRVGDGLKIINSEDEINEVIISGMGGLEIVKILKESKLKFNHLILQPQNFNIELKKYLINNNYDLIFDIIIKDSNKFYNIIKAELKNEKCDIDDFYLYFGKDNFNNKDFICYLNYLEDKINKFIFKLKGDNFKEKSKILKYINKAKNKLEEL